MTLGFLVSSTSFMELFRVSWEIYFARVGCNPLRSHLFVPENFVFYMRSIVSTELPNLVPPQRIDDCYAIHFIHWELLWSAVIKSQNVPLWARLYQYVFCKRTLLFSSSRTYRNVDPSESAFRYCAYPSSVPLLLALPLVNHEKKWKCPEPQAQGYLVALRGYFHQQHFPWTPAANPALPVRNRFVLLRVLHFEFFF